MRQNQNWWAHVDFGGEHRLAVAGEQPGGEWFGPFRNFTEARQALLDAGAYEAKEIHDRNVWWRNQRKSDLIEWGLVVGVPEKGET